MPFRAWFGSQTLYTFPSLFGFFKAYYTLEHPPGSDRSCMFEQETEKAFKEKAFGGKGLDRKDFPQKFAGLTSKPEPVGVSGHRSRFEDPKQRQLMLAALALLMVALCFVLYRDRDFWFPDAQEAQLEDPAETAPASAPAAATPAPSAPNSSNLVASGSDASTSLVSPPMPARGAKSSHHASTRTGVATAHSNVSTTEAFTPVDPGAPDPPPAVVSNRTVLPPLNVEVVAGDTHRTLRPGTNSVRVDLSPGAKNQSQNQPTTEVPAAAAPDITTPAVEVPDTTATVTSNASERVQMSPDTEEVVSHPVKPGYPLLARQMKVQGSVILRALIGKDGMIQDLHVLSGPHILASAAQDAVRQWHFKPHYEGDEAVETQAKITVNFTISTN
jgi:protein TonB